MSSIVKITRCKVFLLFRGYALCKGQNFTKTGKNIASLAGGNENKIFYDAKCEIKSTIHRHGRGVADIMFVFAFALCYNALKEARNMQQILIDKEKCIGCGMCVKDCVASAITIEDGKAVMRKGCIECGHCFAICPTGAVDMPGYNTSGCGEVVSLSEIDSARFLQGIKSRRTIRQFQKRPVEAVKIKKILEAGRYAPTAKNAQNVAFTVLTSRRAEIERECVKFFRTGVNVGSKFIPLLRNSEIDDHFFFKGAPLVIIVSGYDSVDPSLASAYMELMANSLGLGVLYSGFFRACTILNPLIKARLKLPFGHKVVTCMIIGYPAVEYKRIPPRKTGKTRKR